MSALIFYVLLSVPSLAGAALCSKALDGQPCTPDSTAETKKIKDVILADIAAAQDMKDVVKMLEIRYRAARNDPNVSAEAALAELEPYREKKRQESALYQDAITKTLALYHIQPDGGEPMPVAAPLDSEVGWIKGKVAHWDPRVTESGPNAMLVVKIENNGQTHYQGRIHMDTKGDDGVLGLTLMDGRVLILQGTFDKVLEEKVPNPGFLASVLYHESRHFTRLNHESTSEPGHYIGWTVPEREEVIAYDDEIKMAHVFGLTDDEIQEEKRLRKAKADAIRDGNTTSYRIDPADEQKWQKYYDEEQLDIEEDYKKLKVIVEQDRKIQERIAEEEARKRREESDREATRASLRATLAALTNQCGFQPVFGPPTADVFWSEAKPGNVIKGYVNKYSPLDAYTFPTAQTWDDLKVTLMLTRSCSLVDPSVDGTNESVAPPCNEGVDILNAHAHDQAFLDRISAQVTMKDGTGFGSPNRHYVYGCVSDILKQFRFPLTVKKYQKAFEAQAERNARIRKEKEKQHEQESEAPGRSDRRAPRERPQKPYDPCRDNGNIRCPQW
ncbi:MAG TPA: hypothetical protein VN915_01665 [Elusimicrobiota bacterium]|nr:hypothetical protein [Elusimicrobiota bacterium]